MAAKRLTGHRFQGCPLRGAWSPWVHRALQAHEQTPAGVRQVYGTVPYALVQAADVIGRALRRREAEEARVQREAWERRMKKGGGEE